MARINFNCSEFCGSCFDVTKFTLSRKPEIVFVGRSNVGKSSMINALLNRKNFARTGATPGKTVCINSFEIDKKIYLTDLPGYGYAKRSKQQREDWGGLIGDYLDLRRDVRLCLFAIDIRHDPSEADMLMYNYLMQKNFLFCVVATKSDKLNKTELKTNTDKLSHVFGINVIPFSAGTKLGTEQIRQIIDDVTLPEENGANNER